MKSAFTWETECVLRCSSQCVGVQTDILHSAVNGFKKLFLMKYFLVSLRSHDLKSTVLVDVVRRPGYLFIWKRCLFMLTL